MKKEDIAPPGYRIYPKSTPEFCLVKADDGTVEQYVRYINTEHGYTGKWMKVNLDKIED